MLNVSAACFCALSVVILNIRKATEIALGLNWNYEGG